MQILVTGGAGYLGSMLAGALLEQGHAVRVLDSLLHGGRSLLALWNHPGFTFYQGDIRDRELCAAALSESDVVVHLAALVGDPACARDPTETRAVNLEASLALLEDCRRSRIRQFVFASTCSNYGRMPDHEGYVDEQSELAPLSLYAESKVLVERELLAARQWDRMMVTSLRFATLYGVSARMRFDLTVNEFTLALLRDRHLTVYGEQFWRPYVHVRDAARAICRVLNMPEAASGEVYNVGATSENFRKRDLVEMILEHAPGASIEYVERKEDPRDYRVRCDKIARNLDFSITRTVPDGIAEVARLVTSDLLPSFADRCFRN